MKKAVKKIQKKKTMKKAAKKTNTKEMRNSDVIQLILQDHKPLKKLIQILKNTELSLSRRQKAFEEFSGLLTVHAISEEEALYTHMKQTSDLREDGFEGDVEHGLADQMVEEAKRADDADLWSARVKVLAELVEHHIEEEENEQFPQLKKKISSEERAEIGQKYLRMKRNIKPDGNLKSPELAEQPQVPDDVFVQH